MAKIFTLSYDNKVAPQSGINYGGNLGYEIYKLDPAERDAWHIGDGVEFNLKK